MLCHDKAKIPVPDVVAEDCDLFQIDPYTSISEGTLLITCRPKKAVDPFWQAFGKAASEEQAQD